MRLKRRLRWEDRPPHPEDPEECWVRWVVDHQGGRGLEDLVNSDASAAVRVLGQRHPVRIESRARDEVGGGRVVHSVGSHDVDVDADSDVDAELVSPC